MRHSFLHKRFLLSLTTLLCCCLLQAGPSFASSEQGEAKVKTAYIYNFSKYTTWPPSLNDGPLDICLLQSTDVLAEQLVALEKRLVQSKNISIQILTPLQETTGCEVLFIGNSDKNQIAESLNGIKSKPILTVSDRPGFAEQGGMIELIRKDTKIRFIINTAAVNRAGLSLSSRLLKLAIIIHGDENR